MGHEERTLYLKSVTLKYTKREPDQCHNSDTQDDVACAHVRTGLCVRTGLRVCSRHSPVLAPANLPAEPLLSCPQQTPIPPALAMAVKRELGANDTLHHACNRGGVRVRALGRTPPPQKKEHYGLNCRTLLHMHTRTCVCGALVDLCAAPPNKASDP